MNQNVEKLCTFLDRSKSVYHSAQQLRIRLEEEGYTCLPEGQNWDLKPGGKYYTIRNGAAVMAFRIPENAPAGFMICAGHDDRPTFKVKENPALDGKYLRLGVEPYGGMLMSTWLDRPLSVAGRVLVECDGKIESRLLDIDRDLLMIPNVAIHMNRKANEGQNWNAAVDMIPLLGTAGAQEKLEKLLEENAGGKILGHDLYLYVRQKASVWGLEEEYISAPALDDLACIWCSLEGFLAAEDSRSVPLFCAFDNEEVGSETMQGAGSNMLELVILRICRAMGWEKDALLSQTFMLSADNAHAIHPNHPEYADPNHAPVLNGGVVIKYNANQRYTTDGVSSAVFRMLCQKADVQTQSYCNRSDIPGGSTLGHIAMGHVSVYSIDIGLPQLAMHSCYETIGARDVESMLKMMTCFYSSTFCSNCDSTYQIT